MMPGDCEQIREQLSAHVDGALEAGVSAAVEAHLATCADCRAARDVLQALDANLTQTLRPLALRSAIVADRAVMQWQAELPMIVARPFAMRSLMRYLAAAAAGFLLAALVFGQRSRPDQPASAPVVPDGIAVSTKPVAARIVLATGPLQFKSEPAADWETVAPEKLATFTCPMDSCLRTDAASVCELSTPAGGQVRLNEKTEVCLPAMEELQLVSGQLWCQTPNETPLRMTTAADTRWTIAGRQTSVFSFKRT
jgi:hypothetical protein